MSVALPPPQAPLAISAVQIPSDASAYSTRFQARPLLIQGAPLTPDEIELSLSGAANLDEALRQLSEDCQLAGFPAVRLLYAVSSGTIHVLVVPGSVQHVNAVAPLDRYFNPLAGAAPLTASQFEKARALATLHADRAGITSTPHFTAGDTLQVDADETTKTWDLSLQVDNSGDRFVGRNFLELEGSLGTFGGDLFRVVMREGLGGSDADSSYHRPTLGWSRVTPLGTFDVEGSYARYQYVSFRPETLFAPAAELPLDSTAFHAEASWLYLLHADFSRRWTAQLLFDYSGRKVELETDGSTQRDETYPALQLASTWSTGVDVFGQAFKAETSLTLRHGLGGDSRGVLPADLDYFLLKPTLRLDYSWSDKLGTTLLLSGQFSHDILPEQEQFYLGGTGNAGAWLPGVAVGDNGYVARLQTEWLGEWKDNAITPRLFIEHGGASFNPSGPGTGTEPQLLTDAGVELAFEWSTWLEGALSYALPVHDEGIPRELLDRDESHLYFRIAAKL